MRIAQIAPLYEAVPPRLYGGTERVVSVLTEALVRLGQDVTLFASGDSRTMAMLVPGRNCAVRLDTGLAWDLPAHLAMLEDVRQQADSFDILHFHTECLHMPGFAGMAAKTVTTLHGRLDIEDLHAFYAKFPQFPLVSISNDQRAPLRRGNFVATVYHGLPIDCLRFTSEPRGGYLAFLGRICRDKRPDRAIEIAKRAGVPLKIAAKVDRADQSYFEDHVRPLLDDPSVEFIGEIGDAEKASFLGNAQALVFPIDWPEPFGLVMIEAFACGTPVIGWPCGAVPEVINHGITGYIVDDIDSAAEAVHACSGLDRHRIRKVFEERFSDDAMAQNYVDIYRQLVSRHTAHHGLGSPIDQVGSLAPPVPVSALSLAAQKGRQRPSGA